MKTSLSIFILACVFSSQIFTLVIAQDSSDPLVWNEEAALYGEEECYLEEEMNLNEETILTDSAGKSAICLDRYRVESGDSCSYIAAYNDLTLTQFLNINPGLNCNPLAIGTNVCVSGIPLPWR